MIEDLFFPVRQIYIVREVEFGYILTISLWRDQ
jgi:hypothetical protein